VNLREIIIPTHCPACNTELDIVNDQLFCRNDTCPAKSSKRVEHFAKTLRIKGLGSASIEKLDLQDYHDIYSLTEDEISTALKSEKLGEKLFAEIENSKSANLTTLLPAFSIPLIGSSASNKLTRTISDISEITYQRCIDAGLGPKAASNLVNWLDNTFYPMEYDDLPFTFTCEKSEVDNTPKKGVVCITGKLKSYPTKAVAQEVLLKHGFETKDNLTKDVTILLNESGIESAKTNKARDMGIIIYDNIKTLIKEN
jgi:NAD-dependent DNA ligase